MLVLVTAPQVNALALMDMKVLLASVPLAPTIALDMVFAVPTLTLQQISQKRSLLSKLMFWVTLLLMIIMIISVLHILAPGTLASTMAANVILDSVVLIAR